MFGIKFDKKDLDRDLRTVTDNLKKVKKYASGKIEAVKADNHKPSMRELELKLEIAQLKLVIEQAKNNK